MGIGHAQAFLNSDEIHQFLCTFGNLRLGEAASLLQRLLDGVLHADTRIQRGIGILEDDVHLLTQTAQILALGVGDILTVHDDMAVGRVKQTNDGTPQRGFAAAGLAHDAHGMTLFNVEGHVIHCVVDAGADIKIFFQMLYFKKGHNYLASFPRSHRLHATRCPGETSYIAISPALHCSHTLCLGQRGWKAHPSGRFVGSGGSP